MNKFNMKRLMAFFFCLMFLMTTLVSLAAPLEDVDARNLGNMVILEDPDLIGDPEEWMEGVLEEPPETTEPTTDPTGEPTQPPTDKPSTPPSASYEIDMESPDGWYANRAVMEMTIHDVGGTGWDSVRVTIARGSGTITLIDGPLPSGHIWIDLLENCTVEVVVADPYGEQHSREVTVNCFDKDNPSLTASVKGEYLYIETSDRQSGVVAVQVNGTTYTELNDGKLEIWLKQYADAYEQLLVQAVDRVGNVSKAIAIANPFYQHTVSNTQQPTSAPTVTPKPTKKPSQNNNNSDSESSNGSKATPTPTPTPVPTATPVPEYLPLPTPTIEAGFPFYSPGNAMTRDLLYDRYTNKQFIAIETRGGDVFYIVIDYDKPLDDKGERYETYFLNLVDSRDMMDIVDPNDIQEPEIVYVTPEPTEQPTPAPIVPEPPAPEKKGNGGMVAILGILALAGGGAFWYFKIRKPDGGKAQPEYDDYDYDDDDDDYDDDDELINEDE